MNALYAVNSANIESWWWIMGYYSRCFFAAYLILKTRFLMNITGRKTGIKHAQSH